ncbi:MAG: phage tail tape measure protein, partial [Synergistaceae bacterium]|nr:phage tail tape measure protein [Synergistaceae bacterium]
MTKSRLSFHIGANTSEAEKAFKEFEKRFDRFSKKVSGAGKAWSAYISAPLAGVGALAAKFAKDVDDALDDIRIGTGATGSALRALGEDFRAVAANVPQNFAESSKAIADLNTMLGATGKELQALATAGLDASRMMKLDLGAVISSASKAMNNWGISASNGVSLMDKLFVASQSTGAGIDRIADGLSRFGPAFRALGFESEQAMAIIAQFDKYGVQTDAVLGSLNKALSTLAKAGIKDAGQAFEQIIGSIRDAKDGQSAMTLAAQVFGTKVGASWVQAIREGKINIDDLVRALRGADGSIRKTAKATDGFAEQLERTKNALALALEPLGTQLLAIAEEELKSLAETLKGVNLEFNSATVKIGLFVAGIGPALVGLASLVRAFKELIGVMKLMAPLIPLGPAAVVGAIGYGAYARNRNLNKLRNGIADALGAGDKEGFIKLRAQEITNYNYGRVDNPDLLRR